MYYYGERMPENNIEAYAWVLLAKNRWDEEVGEIIEALENLLTAEQRAERQSRAAELDLTIPRE